MLALAFMLRTLSHCLLLAFLCGILLAASADKPMPELVAAKTKVMVIPVKGPIADPVLFIIRRGLKEQGDAVVLDIDTLGGEAGATLSILETLEKFPGRTISYVNRKAISAGALISIATQKIYFSPGAVIGAAAPVSGDGKDIEATMKEKSVSYMTARARAISEGKGRYRADVISAMIDADFELKIGDEVIKPKGKLLSLTSTEALKGYGEPSQPLLGAGVAATLDEVLAKEFGPGGYEVRRLEVTWSENVAQFLSDLKPLLIALAMLAMFVEMKTPGFGVFGITSIVLFAVVFISGYVAGLSGHEPMLVFGLGFILVMLELLFFPGLVFVALSGVVLMFGALIWGMADLWPNQPLRFSGDVFLRPIVNLTLGLAIAVAMGAALIRFIPKGWFWDRLAVAEAVGGAPAPIGSPDLIGRQGMAATALFPSGQIEIDGQRYEARLEVGSLAKGARVVVVRQTDFSLIVEEAKV